MADNNNNPQYEIPLTDCPTINDVEEKPYYDDSSTPVDKNYNNINDQTPDNNNPSSNTIEQTTPTIQDTEQCCSQKDYNYKDANDLVCPPESVVKIRFDCQTIMRILLSILLIIDQIIPIILQLTIYSIIPPVIAINIVVIIIAILHLLFLLNVIKEEPDWFFVVYVNVWCIGFFMEIIWSTISYADNKFIFVNFAFIFSRSFLMIMAYYYGH